MSYYPIVGARFQIGTVLASAKTISAASNGAPPVLTSTTHGYVDGDEVLYACDWEDFNESVFRVDQLTTDTFSLPLQSSVNTDFYPAGGGVGTTKKVTTWLSMGQVLEVTGGGGTPRNETLNPLDRRNPVLIPTGFDSATINFVLGMDLARTDQQTLLGYSNAQTKVPFKFVLPGGGYLYAYGIPSMSRMPTFDRILKVGVSIAVAGIPVMQV